jgi:plasmid replication initiation protein
MENKLRISKSKSLVEASYRLSLDEKRVVQYAITKVNPFKYLHGQAYSFNVLDFARCYGLDEKSCYIQANRAIDQLFDRKVTYWDDLKKMNVTCRLIINKFDNKKGSLGVRFSDEMHKMLTMNKDFLSYAVKHTVSFTSPSSMRIYELVLYKLQRCEVNKLVKKFNINDLKETLGLADKYKRFADFKKYVLDTAKMQINKHSDIRISYTIIKAGRTPTDIIITAKFKDVNKNLGSEEDQPDLPNIDVKYSEPTDEQRAKRKADLKSLLTPELKL